MDRRGFVKVGAAGAAIGGVAAAGTAGRLALERAETERELEARRAGRPAEGGRWLAPAEFAALSALAAVIVPADEGGPGALEAGVPEALDRRLARTPARQGVYARGLLSFEEAAEDEYGAPLAELSAERRESLLRRIEGMYREKVRRLTAGSRLDVLRSKLSSLENAMAGQKAAVDFVSTLIPDVLREFYSSPVTWAWLGYEGPPFPGGYAEDTRHLGPVPPGVPIERAPHGPIRAPCGGCHEAVGDRG